MSDDRKAADPFARTSDGHAGADSAPKLPRSEEASTLILAPPPPATGEPQAADTIALGTGPSHPDEPPGAPKAGETGDALVGRVIQGRYKLNRLVGEGGMGGVFEGENLSIGKRVAIKLVHAIHGRDPHIAARIKQEARTTAAIESENIVRVDDAGEDEALGLFVVMEFLKGEDLAALLLRKKRLSPIGAVAIVLQAAQGLSRAHAAGIVHRDLKPANIFLSIREDGSSLVKLVDFGIAKLIRDANQGQHGASLTRMGTVIGTPQYMSPEQAQGLPSVDHRTDIYSLGSVLFEMIVGHSPFPELPTYEQTILQIMTKPAPRLSEAVPGIYPPLDELCAEMMARDADQRPQDMAVVRERLLRMLADLGNSPAPSDEPANILPANDASGYLRAFVDAALREPTPGAPLSSGYLPVSRGPGAPPATHSALSVNPKGLPGEPVYEAKAAGKRTTPILMGVAAAALVCVGAAVAFVRMSAAGDDAKTGSGFAAPSAAPGPSASGAPGTLVDIPPPPAPSASVEPAPPATATALGAGRKPAAGKEPPVKGQADRRPPPTATTSDAGRPVGGTGVTTSWE